MNKIWNAVLRHPKKAMLAGVLAVVGLLPLASNAWGPSRKTFTIEKPADYVVFNSITNNPSNGDERNFVRIKEANTNHKFSNEVNIVAGKKYTVYIYFHNDAAANLQLVANNTRMNTQLPSYVKANTKTAISAKVMADNANPKKVWDEAYVLSTRDVAMKYVAGSATIHSKGAVNGQKLNSNQFLTSGALIGYNALDGKVPGCHEFAGYVTYDFVVEAGQANFTIAKTVSENGKMKFAEEIKTKDNQVVDFKLVYTNVGSTIQKGVTIKDVLPAGMSYVKGSTKVANKKTNGQPVTVSDNITTTGINIGDYTPGANAFILFSAKIDDLSCGQNKTLVNKAEVITQDGKKSDTAQVNVKSEACPTPNPTPVVKDIKVCDLNTKQIITIKENTFNANKHAKDLNKCKTNAVTPNKLPQTGPAETLAQVLGLGALVTSLGYYISSRKLIK